MATIKLAGVAEAVVNQLNSGATPAAATETILNGSQIVVPGPLKVGSRFKWRVSMTKTAAGTGNTSFLVKTNTTTVVAVGTTGGAATALTLAFSVAETAAVGTSLVEIDAIVTKVDPTAGSMIGQLYGASTAGAAVGFSNQQVAAVANNLVTDGTILSVGLAISSGAADAVTINFVLAEFVSP